MSHEERVRVEVADGVATVTMVRGDKHNALDAGMFAGLVAAATRLSTEPGVRAVVLYGEGPSFCSGLDVASFMTGPMSIDELLAREDGHVANLPQRVSTDWAAVPVPVIAAVHGNCFGGGLQIALGADVRIAAPDARLSIMEIKWGLVPDMGITQALPRLVGIDRAKELTWTGRRVSGTEAERLGLVTMTAEDPLAAAQELATDLASRSPDAIRAAKRLYDTAWSGMAPADALRLETTLQTALMGSPNQIAAVTAAMTGEPGTFTDPGAAPPAAVPARP
jgi:enoyl-CoA hydratase/carnithine racemase